ncbi:hypothetical protein SSS_04101 [Sarcoptes scabiei]|uniref:Cytochrome b-c1 complex subunit 1, mitochondrial n=1 Tax=Sarcoptes scabiei TaxID=52283 RepID=A0A132ACZ7_SARSC|nr:hypothetical protein SSS_04101 [Sarcoptes scabiei]KPM08455.1 Insulinase-like protein [Sarcoptes scabiei]
MAHRLIHSTILVGKNSLILGGHRYSHHAAHKFSNSLKQNPDYNLTEIDNGIRIASEKTKSPSATVGVWIDSGVSAENEQLNGITHFIEHLLFRGTKNRSRKQLEQDVHSLGAIVDSNTDREQFNVSITLSPQDVSKAIEILADLIQNQSLNADDIEETRKFILNELEAAENNYEQVVMDHLHSVAYQNTTLAYSKYGPTENIERFTKSDVERGLDLLITSPQLIVAASGNIDHDQLVKDTEKSMKSISNVYEKNQVPKLLYNRFTGSDIRVRDDSMNCAHVAIALKAPSYKDEDFVAMEIASALMGNWDLTHGGGNNVSCYMGMVSNSEHLAQSFKSFNLLYRDNSLWGSYFVGERMQLDSFMSHLQTQWKRLCMEIANNEIRQGKNALMTRLITERDGSANNANSIANDIRRFGHRVSLEEWAERINRVNSSKFRSITENYLWDRCPAIAALGPVENLPNYEEIRLHMKWIKY